MPLEYDDVRSLIFDLVHYEGSILFAQPVVTAWG
jgi:hypothetical protein